MNSEPMLCMKDAMMLQAKNAQDLLASWPVGCEKANPKVECSKMKGNVIGTSRIREN